jgi:outer membrane lipoprotein SlyB
MNKRWIYIGAGALVGAAAGYAYYYFIGCANGTCAITSNPIHSTLYGVLMGGLIGDSIKDFMNKKTNKETNP